MCDERPCRVCGTPIVGRRADAIYCSRKCSTYVLNQRRIDQQRKDYEPSCCEGCGHEFKPRSLDHVCCSEDCYNAARLERERQERRAANPSQRRKCAHCGKWFQSRNPRRIYCCQACGVQHGNQRLYLDLLARSDLDPHEKERRILRIAGPPRNPSPREIRVACEAIQASWSELERQTRWSYPWQVRVVGV